MQHNSVVLVKTDAFDVVPGSRLVAEETLRYVGVLDARDLHRHHLKVHHVVAGRGLVALVAVGRERRRVAELGDGPAALRDAGRVA